MSAQASHVSHNKKIREEKQKRLENIASKKEEILSKKKNKENVMKSAKVARAAHLREMEAKRTRHSKQRNDSRQNFFQAMAKERRAAVNAMK